jgi:Lipocalin-like domain
VTSSAAPMSIRLDSAEDDILADIPDNSGVWLLRELFLENVRTGERIEAFGTNPKGMVIVPQGPRVSRHCARRAAAQNSQEDHAAAFQMIAYSGRYHLEPPDRFVTVVDIVWLQPWAGTEQARTLRWTATSWISSAPRHECR